MFRKILFAFLALILFFPDAAFAARLDDLILSDPVSDVFSGTMEGGRQNLNLRFLDLPAELTAQDAIARSGAYGLFRGGSQYFRPYDAMTYLEAIVFVIEASGRQADARVAGELELAANPALAQNAPEAIDLGYLALARNSGLINAAQFAEAFLPLEPIIDPNTGEEVPPGPNYFRALAPISRQDFANLLVRSVFAVNATAFDVISGLGSTQSVYNFSDFEQISAQNWSAIEQLVRSGVMTGSGGLFRPQDNITRLEAAHVGRGLDTILHGIRGFDRRFGAVGAVVDAQAQTTHTGELWRDVRIRNAEGLTDVLRFAQRLGGSAQEAGIYDAVVLKNGVVGGLGLLAVGDSIEYIFHPETETLLYVVVTGAAASRTVTGRLANINFEERSATFMDENGRAHSFIFAQGMLITDEAGRQFVRIGFRLEPLDTFPYTNFFSAELVNNLITGLEFLGSFVLIPEIWGVVLENSPFLGFITILDENRHERTFQYNFDEIEVQRRGHFDMRDTIGGLHAMFPGARINPHETDISAIGPGDLVFIRTDPSDPTRLQSVSAASNYSARYGRILNIVPDGGVYNILLRLENGVESWLEVPAGVPARRDGRVINASEAQTGDWVRFLVSAAILAPGRVLESVKFMELEGAARHITALVRGQLIGINSMQNQLQLQNALSLTPAGWTSYRQLANFSLQDREIEYYVDGRLVNLSYVLQNMRFSNAEVYLALETTHMGERIRMASFRTGRDQLLPSSVIVSSDGLGGFGVLSTEGQISADNGTIVVRNGRLVDPLSIFPWDYATVSLNGSNTAALVNIGPAPDASGVIIARGRVGSVNQGVSFRVQSMAMFDGLIWRFTPIEREFIIDHDTLFIGPDGLTSIDDFIDYTDDSVMDNVYNIIIDGARAARVIDSPYATAALRGIVYENAGGSLSLRDVHTRNPVNGHWTPISISNATATANIAPNTIIVDRNEVIPGERIEIGQQVRIMTTAADFPQPAPGMEIESVIIIVER